jgi:hypothetical protein
VRSANPNIVRFWWDVDRAAMTAVSGTCIWKKQSLVLGRSPYQWQHEPVLFGWKKEGKHNWYSDRKQSTIIPHGRKMSFANCMKILVVQHLLERRQHCPCHAVKTQVVGVAAVHGAAVAHVSAEEPPAVYE